jgi:hypothetical protein
MESFNRIVARSRCDDAARAALISTTDTTIDSTNNNSDSNDTVDTEYSTIDGISDNGTHTVTDKSEEHSNSSSSDSSGTTTKHSNISSSSTTAAAIDVAAIEATIIDTCAASGDSQHNTNT